MPILAMHFIGNSTCLRGAIQDHYGPLVLIVYLSSKAQISFKSHVLQSQGNLESVRKEVTKIFHSIDPWNFCKIAR